MASHFAAKMKSLSVKPPILCVHTSTPSLPQATYRSGWCCCSSAIAPTASAARSASAKFLKRKVRFSNRTGPDAPARSSIDQAVSSCSRSGAMCSRDSGGTPPRQGTQARCARSLMRSNFLVPNGSPSFEDSAIIEGMTARRQAAVAIAIFRTPPHGIVFVERAAHLRDHPGQIGLPGGRVHPEDRDLAATALRELHEEVGIEPVRATIVAELPMLQQRRVNNFDVTPFVAV